MKDGSGDRGIIKAAKGPQGLRKRSAMLLLNLTHHRKSLMPIVECYAVGRSGCMLNGKRPELSLFSIGKGGLFL